MVMLMVHVSWVALLGSSSGDQAGLAPCAAAKNSA